MHYYYDILANFDKQLWKFYEWEKNDFIVAIKKVPFVRISSDDLQNLMLYDVSFEVEDITKYFGKTIFKNAKEKGNCLLFSSGKDNVLLEFDIYGNVINRSSLLVSDAVNCNEVAGSLDEDKIFYKIKNKLTWQNDFRQAEYEKHLIEVELNTLLNAQNINKCAYLYYEWFGLFEDDLEKMVSEMRAKLKNDYSLKIHEIASIIKMSYKECL